jgi:hypothetical protein
MENKNSEKGIFSKALFRESLKSHKTIWLTTTIGNCLILVIIIGILSTLSINSTKAGLTNLFNTAEMEHTLKSSAAEAYVTYDTCVNEYNGDVETLTSGSTELYSSAQSTMSGYDMIVHQKVGTKTYGELLLSTYKNNLKIASGDDDKAKEDNAQNSTKTTIMAFVDSSQDVSQEVKAVAPYFIDSFIDTYQETNSNDVASLATQSFPLAGYNYLSSQESLKSYAPVAKALISETITQYRAYDDNTSVTEEEKQNIATNVTKTSITALIPSTMDNYLISKMTDLILQRYIANESDFSANTDNYRDQTKIQAILIGVKALAQEFAYYDKLPTFEVKYVTDDLGYPIYFDENGKAVEITKIEDRDKLVLVKQDMGSDANFLEKMHKKLITGEDYTDAEITEAQSSTTSIIDSATKLVNTFFTDYLASPDTYYDFTKEETIKSALKTYAVNYIQKESSSVICDTFDVTSLDELTKQKDGVSGEELLQQVSSYSTSAIDVYENYYASCTAKGYDSTSSMMVAICKSGIGITDQLPTMIKENLSEMANMNVYGLIVGLIFFDCAGLLLPMVYTMMTANDLIAGQVDSGSLAFILSTPTKRNKITFTQLVFLFTSIFVSYVLLFATACLSRAIGVAAGSTDLVNELTYTDLALDSLGGFGVIFAIAGICFLTSCIFDKTKNSLGVGGGITIFFLVASIIGIFGSKAMPSTVRINQMNYFNFVTIVRLFDCTAVINHDYGTYFWKLAILFAIGILSSCLGCLKFNKKDLPL